jgi:hypothetical protein
MRIRTLPLAMLTFTAACAPAVVATAQDQPAPSLAVSPLAGQRIPLLPVSYLVAEPAVDSLLASDRTARMAWADSILAQAFTSRGPEVVWVLPEELRRVAQRAPNLVSDPDRMGQALLRSTSIKRVPDPLRSYLRSLTAMTDSRFVMVPAAVRFTIDSSTNDVRAETILVLTDSRNGAVLWRSNPVAVAATPEAALEATINHILPDFN